jgi:two-component system, cell cycle response regulator DivK
VSERRTSAADRRTGHRGGRRHADYSGRPVVLVIDDHVDSRELLAAVLREIGVSLAEAGTGREALERLAALPLPSLVLLDLSLPDCHGTDIVRTLKADPRTRQVPVIALSASVRATDKESAAAAGCEGFIEKPLLPDEVVDLVRRVLDGAPL